MSNSVFPTLSGLKWDQITAPEFNTSIKRAVSLKEYRSLGAQYPLWNFSISYDVLRDANWAPPAVEIKQLIGFYNKHHGAFDSWLFVNPNDNSVVGQQFGTGDGSTASFQLSRSFGDTFTLSEPVQNVNALTGITFNTVTQNSANYSLSATGNVTFNAPSLPPIGANIAWTGSYYYRCRFTDDSVEFNNLMRGLWEARKVLFVGSPMNKV